MEEGTSIREYIEIILKGKWVIIGVTSVFIIFSATYNLLMFTPQYESRATVMVNQAKSTAAPQQQGSSLDIILQALFKQPEATLETYRSQVTNPLVLKNVIEALKLEPDKYSVGILEKSIKAEVVKNTNNITIIVKGNNPKEVSLIANSVASNFIKLISGQYKQQVDQSMAFLDEQRQKQEKELEQAMDEYKKFLSQPRGVQELRAEMDAKIKLITNFKSSIYQNHVESQKLTSSLAQLDSDISQMPEKQILKKTITDDPYLMQITGVLSGESARKISELTVESEHFNSLQLEAAKMRGELSSRISGINGQQVELQRNINQLKQEMRKLKAELAEKQTTEERLTQKLKTLKNDYQSLSDKYAQTRLAQSARLGELQINIISPAFENGDPVTSRRLTNVVVAGILGAMISMFMVFVVDYLRRSKVKEQS